MKKAPSEGGGSFLEEALALMIWLLYFFGKLNISAKKHALEHDSALQLLRYVNSLEASGLAALPIQLLLLVRLLGANQAALSSCQGG